jgi:LPXTG-motif cell wall-anchored protein
MQKGLLIRAEEKHRHTRHAAARLSISSDPDIAPGGVFVPTLWSFRPGALRERHRDRTGQMKRPGESRGDMRTNRQILSLLLITVAMAYVVLSAQPPPARASSAPSETAPPLAQVPQPTPTPSLTTPTPSATSTTTLPPTPTPTDPAQEPLVETDDEEQDTAEDAAGSLPEGGEGVEDAADGVENAAEQAGAGAGDPPDAGTGDIGDAVGQAAAQGTDATRGAAQGETDLQAGTWAQVSNAERSSDSDLAIVVGAGNDVMGEPPAEAGERDGLLGDPPNPWWLPVTGSQWLVVAAVVALLLIALGGVLVAVRWRRRHSRAEWAQ